MRTYRLPTILQSCQHHRCKGCVFEEIATSPQQKNHMRSLALSPSSKKNLQGKTFFWTVHQVVSQQNPDFWIDMLFWKMVGKTVAIKPRWTCTEVIASGKWSLSQNTSREGQKWLHWIGIKICLRMRKKRTQSTSQNFFKKTVCWQHHLFFHINMFTKTWRKHEKTWCFHCFFVSISVLGNACVNDFP